MVRLTLGVVIGYAVFALTAVLIFAVPGRDPHAVADPFFMVGAIGAGVLAAGTGGYLGAVFARGSEHAAGLMIAVIIATAAIISLVAQPAAAAKWTEISTLVLMSPAAYLGALIRWRRVHRRS
jgi:hypothetical protein